MAMEGASAACSQEDKEILPTTAAQIAFLAFMAAEEGSAEGSTTSKDALVARFKASLQGHEEAVAKAATLAAYAKDVLSRTTDKMATETVSVESAHTRGVAAAVAVDPSCTAGTVAASATDSITKDTTPTGVASGAGAQPTPEARGDAACGLDAKSRLELAKATMFHWQASSDRDSVHDITKPFDQTTWHLVVRDCCGKGDMDTLCTLLVLDTDHAHKPVVARYNLLGAELLGTFIPQSPQKEQLRDFMETATANGRFDVLQYLSRYAAKDGDQFWSDATKHAMEHNRGIDMLGETMEGDMDPYTYVARYDPARVCKMSAARSCSGVLSCPIEVRGGEAAVFVALAGKGHEAGLRARALSGDAYPFAVAMTEAAANGHRNVVKYLATRTDTGKAGALVVAARHGRTDIVIDILSEVMIYANSDPDDFSVTFARVFPRKILGVDMSVLECALSWAAWHGHRTTAKILLHALGEVYHAAGKDKRQLFHHCVWPRLCANNAWILIKEVHFAMGAGNLQTMPEDIQAVVIDGVRACLTHGPAYACTLEKTLWAMGITYKDVLADDWWAISYQMLMMWRDDMKTWKPKTYVLLQPMLEELLKDRVAWLLDTRLRIMDANGVPDDYWCPEAKSAYDALGRALDKQLEDSRWPSRAKDAAEEPGAAQ